MKVQWLASQFPVNHNFALKVIWKSLNGVSDRDRHIDNIRLKNKACITLVENCLFLWDNGMHVEAQIRERTENNEGNCFWIHKATVWL